MAGAPWGKSEDLIGCLLGLCHAASAIYTLTSTQFSFFMSHSDLISTGNTLNERPSLKIPFS